MQVHLLKFAGESENSNVHFVTEAKREGAFIKYY